MTRQTFENANQKPCENNPQDPDNDQYYVLTQQPNQKDPPQLFESTQTAISPITFTTQDAGNCPQKIINNFGIVFSSLNILMIPYNSLVKLLAMIS